MMIQILWAVSSVGKGHLIRDIAIVSQLQRIADVAVDWLAPEPAGGFLQDRGYNVLACSAQLGGSGKAYQQVFEGCTVEFNLVDYIRADTQWHQHDFAISAQAWKNKAYDVIVGDEAFWLLSGFGACPSAKPVPFIFLTDFIGMKVMRPRIGDILTTWRENLKFTMSHFVPDVYVYIGNVEEIPNERFGFLLPSRRKWAQQHCRFVKPIVGFEPDDFADQDVLRKRLGLPVGRRMFLALVGPEGNYLHRMAQIERAFEFLEQDFPGSYFILVAPEVGGKNGIQYHYYLEKLYEYFAASDCVLIQSGYGKVAELAALGIPFIAIPLDYHFEQEYMMAHRLESYRVGKLLPLRDYSPNEIAQEVKKALQKQIQRVPVDIGIEVGRIILETVRI